MENFEAVVMVVQEVKAVVEVVCLCLFLVDVQKVSGEVTRTAGLRPFHANHLFRMIQMLKNNKKAPKFRSLSFSPHFAGCNCS